MTKHNPQSLVRQLTLYDLEFARIRRTMVDEVEYFSLVDVMAEFTDIKRSPRKLWNETNSG